VACEAARVLIGCSLQLILHVEDRAINDVRYHIAIDRLRALGWAPEVKFDDGLQRTRMYRLLAILLFNKFLQLLTCDLRKQ